MEWEFDFLYALQGIRTPFLDRIMALLSTLGNAGLLWIVIAVVLCISKKYRRGGMQMLSAELLGFIVGNLIIKNLVNRLRPCQIDETVSLIVMIPFDSSFPSGHTLNGITAAVTLMFIDKREWEYRRLCWLYLLLFQGCTTLCIFRRMYLWELCLVWCRLCL